MWHGLVAMGQSLDFNAPACFSREFIPHIPHLWIIYIIITVQNGGKFVLRMLGFITLYLIFIEIVNEGSPTNTCRLILK